MKFVTGQLGVDFKIIDTRSRALVCCNTINCTLSSTIRVRIVNWILLFVMSMHGQ